LAKYNLTKLPPDKFMEAPIQKTNKLIRG
ncbi:MAG: hypothetical protein JWR69_2525, partial [Pedosphaera sp.]|nr:hypothetical protein [Pedosphaera sp.]